MFHHSALRRRASVNAFVFLIAQYILLSVSHEILAQDAQPPVQPALPPAQNPVAAIRPAESSNAFSLKDFAQTAQSLVTAIAVLLGGAFFIYKVRSGYHITNLKLSLSCKRQACPGSSTEDYVVVTTKIAKLDRGSVEIHDLIASFSIASNPNPTEVRFGGIRRCSFEPANDGTSAKRINSDKISKTSPFLRLSPGEETEFSCYHQVPRTEPCTASVVLLGKRASSSRFGQWKASCVLLPN
jgi:hypothetical protein